MYNIEEILERNPIIPAIKNDSSLKEAIESSSEIVFLIMGNILKYKRYCRKIKRG